MVPEFRTVNEFLAWERQQEGSFEFDGERVIEVNGGALAHYLIASNLLGLIRPLIDRRRYWVFAGGVKLLNEGRIRYPDLMVAHTAGDMATDIALEPVVVVEVISPSSGKQDRVIKSAEYRAVATIQQYIILEQDAVLATVWLRQGEAWTATTLTGNAPLELPSLSVSVPLIAVYEGVTLPAGDAALGR